MLTTKNRSSRPRIPVSTAALLILLAASLVFGGYYFRQYRTLKNVSSKSVDQTNKELVQKINSFYQLPTGEEPAIIAVTKDPSEFTTDQEKQFSSAFKDLKKGDNVLLYEKAGQAILYRPAQNKVISTVTLTVKQPIKISIIASASDQTTAEKTLLTKYADNIKITSKTIASGSYTQTQVIDLSGKQADAAKTIAETLGGVVATAFPTAEKTPDKTDIVVIIGSVAKPTTDVTPVTP